MAVLKLLRNENLFETREAALNDIASRSETFEDGMVWIASYGETPNAKTLLAIKRDDGVTVFDNENMSDAINTLNYSDDAVAKKFVTSVSQTNGLISVQRGEITSDNSINLTDGSDGGVNFGVNIKNDEKVLNLTNQGLQTDISLKKITTGLSANIKEQYQLVGTNDTQLGNVTIDIYKNSSLLQVKLSTTDATWDAVNETIVDGTGEDALVFAYEDKNSVVQLVHVNVGSFLRESEITDGLEVVNHDVKVKIDTTSNDAENFLSVSSDGVKISGINSAISSKVGTLDATVKANLDNSDDTKVEEGKHFGIKIIETDGKLTSVSVVEDNIASQSYVTEIERVTAEALNDLNERIENVYTKEDIDDKGYLTEHQDISGKADVSVVQRIERVTAEALNDLNTRLSEEISTRQEADNSKADVSDVYTKDEVYTKTESDAKYLTEHQDISSKADVSDVERIERVTAEALNDIELRKLNKEDIEEYLSEIDCDEY